MNDSQWPPDEIKKLAQSSGKPLEISTAAAFLKNAWSTRLGSYFTDGQEVRELDVLAVREMATAARGADIRVRLRAQVSCKGFRPTCTPVVYSVSKTDASIIRPRLPFLQRLPQTNVASLTVLPSAVAAWLLKTCGLSEARPIVAFDVVEREDPKPKQNEKKPSRAPIFKSAGDRLLHEGLDSALKATFHWMRQESLQPGGPTYYATLYVPILVLARPFFDVCIDGGVAGNPELIRRGYQTSSYPLDPSAAPLDIMSIVWAYDELRELVDALDQLFSMFFDHVDRFIKTSP